MYTSPTYKEFLENIDEFRDPDELFQEIKRYQEENNAAYAVIMTSADGNPIGIEFKHQTAEQWAFIVPEMSHPERGPFRAQYFDERGFYTHDIFKSLELAVEEMAKGGFTELAAGALDSLSSKPAWNRGIEITDIIRRSNANMISWEQAHVEFDLVNRKYESQLAVV